MRRALLLGWMLAGCAAALGCKRGPMDNSLAPTRDDLERAYRTPDPRLAGHQQAEAVIVDAAGITVLCSANPRGNGEHTWLVRLTDDGSLAWEQHYPPDQGIGRAMAALADGGFAIAGEVASGTMAYQAHVLRIDAQGQVVASDRAGPGGPDSVAGFTAVAALADGSLLVGGAVRDERHAKGSLVDYDRALKAAWQSSLDDEVIGLVPLGAGYAVVARHGASTTGLGRTRVSAFTADRTRLWTSELPITGPGEPAAAVALSDGLAMIGHHAASERARAQIWVARLTTTGDVAWQRLLGHPDEERRGRAITALPDGGVAIAGDALRDGRRGLRVARLAADGAALWEHIFGGEHDVARGIAATPDGGLVVVGATSSRGAGKTNAWILRLDGDGRMIWDRALGTAG